MALNKSRLVQLLRQASCILRLLEIIFAIICLSLVRSYFLMGGQPDWFLLSFFTPAADLLITPTLILYRVIEDPLKPPLSELLLDAISALLYLTSGVCSFKYYGTFYTAPSFKRAGNAFGAFCLFSAIAHLGNVICAYWNSVTSLFQSLRTELNQIFPRA